MRPYALRPPVLAWVAGMAIGSAVVDALSGVPVLGYVLIAAWWLLAFKLASEALLRAAEEREDEFEVFAGDGGAFWQIILGLGVLAGAVLLEFFGSPGALVVYLCLVALLLPAAIVVLVRDESFLHALNPFAWLALVQAVGARYFVAVGQFALLAVASVLVVRVMVAGVPMFLANALAHGVFVWLLLAGYHGLGRMLVDRGEAPAPRPTTASRGGTGADAPAKPLPVSHEEKAAVADADRLLAQDQPAAAAGVLDRLIRGRGASAPVQARYRALLAQLGDAEGLQRHAQHYIPVLLQLGQAREAMALYHDARQRDPAFELGDPQPLSDLIAHAARTQQSQVAVALWEEFARRFPRDRDLVLNGLTAAKLMDRLGRDDEARDLLRDLQQRFPEHALAAELEAALQAVRP